MRSLMLAVLSPYHLTTREAPTTVASMLAEHVVTLIPGPGPASSTSNARAAAGRAPAWEEFMRSWAWSVPLWREGVLGRDLDGDGGHADLSRVIHRLRDEDVFAALRPFVRESIDDDEDAYLNLISRDMLRGGPDPGLSLPLLASLDRFAGRHEAIVMRSHASSVAQQVEANQSRTICTFLLPQLVQADAERILLARGVLDDVLVPWRDAAVELASAVRAASPLADLIRDLNDASCRFADTFDRRRSELFDESIHDDVRPIECTTSISFVVLPADAVLRSSVTAFHDAVRSRRPAAAGVAAAPNRRTSRNAQPAPAIQRVDADDARQVVSMVIRPLGRR